MSGNPGFVVKRPYPKTIFTRADVEIDQAENEKDGATTVISEDDQTFYLTTTWPPIDSPAAAPSATAPAPPTATVGPSKAQTPQPVPAPAPAPPPTAPIEAVGQDAPPSASPVSFGSFRTTTAMDLPSLRDEYQALYDQCATLPVHASEVAKAAARIQAGQDQYSALSARMGGHVPWPFIGITHSLEASCIFSRHLHNGDPMFSGPDGARVWLRTTKKPPNRPPIWPAPAAETSPWLWSGLDAMTLLGFNHEEDWSVPAMLWRFERYNGMGYRQFRNPSPYLWSFSQIYRIGKFKSDGHYDPTLVSDQCGAALVLKELL